MALQSLGRALFAWLKCGFFGGVYGAACAIAWLDLMSLIALIRHPSEAGAAVATMFIVAPVFGGIYGFLAGGIAGLIGGGLGSPVGWGIGGLVGSAAVSWVLVTCNLLHASNLLIVPTLIGTPVALVFGWNLRRARPFLPISGQLAKRVYSSPLGGWLGWQKRLIQ
jgi:hypothetical protein